MSTVHIDIVDGNGGSRTKDGYELTRVASVTGITGGSASEVLVDAIDAVIAVTGDIGSSHPGVSQCKLDSFQADAITTNGATVRIVYKEQSPTDDPEYAEIEVSTTLSQEESNKDVNGVPIDLSYTYPTDYKLDPNKAGKTYRGGGTVSRMVPESSMVYTRMESTSPGPKSRAYVGKVNDGPWSMDETSASVARTWLLVSITGRSSDGGATYSVTYTFQYRAYTWDSTVIFINSDDGKPPPDLVDGVGSKVVQKYLEADFDDLGL